MDRYLYATAGKDDAGRRLKDFLRSRWGLSAALLIGLKQEEDGITVNGERATVGYLLSEGDLVRISVGDHGADSGFEATEMPLDILYEDSDLILLNKPPFLPVHPSKGHVTDTLANGLTRYYHEKGETFVSRCVLRLDANTSGAVLFAKNAYAHDRMRRALLCGEVKKEYRALVHGKPPFHGFADAPVYRPKRRRYVGLPIREGSLRSPNILPKKATEPCPSFVSSPTREEPTKSVFIFPTSERLSFPTFFTETKGMEF